MHNVLSSILLAILITPFVLFSIHGVSAQVRQSSSYQIQSDSVNFGGGLSSSTNYTQESTFGEVATGESASASYKLRAGYQQMQEVFISLTGASAVSMAPSISGITGGTSNGSTTVTVITDSPSGYSLSINATATPAMQSGANTIADYVPSGDPDFTFTTTASDSHFGYSPEGVDIVQRFRDDGGSVCNQVAGTDSPLSCWDGLSTTAETIASNTGANQPNGATTTINFRVGIGSSVIQPAGTYTATTTLTALPL